MSKHVKYPLAVILLLMMTSTALATGQKDTGKELRVCAAENDLPFSNKDEQGFENKLAHLVGQKLGRPIHYVWWSDPRYFVRDLLNKGRCDLVIALDTGDPRVLTSQPYYRSGYVFVYRKDAPFQLTGWDHEALRKVGTIGVVPGSPPEVMLKQIGRYEDMFNYIQSLVNFKSRRNQHVRWDPARMVAEVAQGEADVAVLWGPAAGRYVKASSASLAMVVIPDGNKRTDGEPVPHHFSQSFAVRKGEKALLAQLNHIVQRSSNEIRALLENEGVPLLPLSESSVNTASIDIN